MVDPKANSPQVNATAESSIHQASDETHGETAQYQVKAGELLPRGFGRYELRALLGRGGMGAVYQAYDPELDRLVALKIPKALGNEIDDWRERFKVEARAAATIQHPNICPVYEVGESNGQPYLTMPLIEGETLASRLRRLGRMPIDEALSLVSLIARSMSEAHQRGIVHRDLKPANIMIDRRGQPIIMDFGLAYRTVGTSDLKVTLSGVALGTPEYMPPEQAGGDHEAIGPSSDVYSLGVVLNELVTGRVPFLGKSFGKLVAQIERDPPPSPSQLNPEVNSALESVILKSLEKQPSDRFSSAIAFANALDAVQRGESLGELSRIMKTQATVLPTAATRWRPLTIIALVGILLVFVAVGAFFQRDLLIGNRGGQKEPPFSWSSPLGSPLVVGRAKAVTAPKHATRIETPSHSFLLDATREEAESWIEAQRNAGSNVEWFDAMDLENRAIFSGFAAKGAPKTPWFLLMDLSIHEIDSPLVMNNKFGATSVFMRSVAGYQEQGVKKGIVLAQAGAIRNGFLGLPTPEVLQSAQTTKLDGGYAAMTIRPLVIDGRLENLGVFFSAVSGGSLSTSWSATREQLEQELKSQGSMGIRPNFVTPYVTNGELRYCYGFSGAPGPFEYLEGWTAAEFETQAKQALDKGLKPESLFAYPWDGAVRYASLWIKDPTTE